MARPSTPATPRPPTPTSPRAVVAGGSVLPRSPRPSPKPTKQSLTRNLSTSSSNSSLQQQQSNHRDSSASTVNSGAANALTLLLSEDPLLTTHALTTAPSPDDEEENASAFSYAAALLHQDQNEGSSGWMSSSGQVQQRATEALAEVDRKLALVESLAERVSRESPEEVAGPLLRLHGYDLGMREREGEEDVTDPAVVDPGTSTNSNAGTTATSLVSTRERCDRLRRQSEVLENVSRRVESTLQRGLHRMERSTSKLSRVLQLSATLKMAMRLRFEARKVQGSGLDLESPKGVGGSGTSWGVDLRDLTRAAASVAVMEGLLSSPELTGGGDEEEGRDEELIDVVESMRPEAEAAASSVRRAAAGLLAEQHNNNGMSASALGATLQVYYHLGELPQAAWNAVENGLAAAEKASSQFFNPAAVQRLLDSATSEAKALSDAEIADIESSSSTLSATEKKKRKKQADAAHERTLYAKLREKKAEAASKWASGISDASLRVWNLHRVLSRKSDPVTRENFLDVVASGPVPEKFRQAQAAIQASSSTRKGGAAMNQQTEKFSIFALFWHQMCIALGVRVQRLLKYDNGSLARDVAALYPAVRSAALDMLGGVHDTMTAGATAASAAAASGSSSSSATGMTMLDDGTAGGTSTGILGGSAGLDDPFLGWGGEGGALGGSDGFGDGYGGGSNVVSADTWTRGPDPTSSSSLAGTSASNRSAPSSATSSSLTVLFSSSEWTALQGHGSLGLYPLQKAFLEASAERLSAPLQFMFPEAVAVDENGVALPVLPALPSRYDLAKLDSTIREELSLADPRRGGGELSMTKMISENVVDMVEQFCARARGATSDAGEEGCLHTDGTATEALNHDVKVAGVMSTLATSLRNAPENTFVIPYRPAQSAQHEEAAHMCQIALLPALHEIETMVKSLILTPLCRALNTRVSSAIAKMHQGTYLENTSSSDPMAEAAGGGSFVEQHLSDLYESVSTQHLSNLPPEYSSSVASTVATYSIYTFVSNASLVRPLGEMGRLRITQDLADFELALEQLVFKGGSSTSLSQMGGGKPYAELRAVRQMLFWTGLDDQNATPADIAKGMLREVWVKDVRPSTAFHFLFSFGPKLLSSPHHWKRMKAEEYVGTLVQLDGSVDDGEASAWMTTMACCDAYQQRESVDGGGGGGGGAGEGDRRVAAILMMLGPELLRRRRQ